MKRQKGRPMGEFTHARAKIRELRGQAKQLETIAKKMRLEAEQLQAEINMQQPITPPKSEENSFMDAPSSFGFGKVRLFTKEEIDARAVEQAEHLFDAVV